MRVYRVERAKRGPYTHPKVSCNAIGIDGYSADRQPMPYSDGIGCLETSYVFGFRTQKQLKSWFHKRDRENLVKARFKCNVYEVPKKHVQIGGKQLIFRHGKAKKLKEIKLA